MVKHSQTIQQQLPNVPFLCLLKTLERVFMVFLAEKTQILDQNIDYLCMNNYSKVIGPSLT